MLLAGIWETQGIRGGSRIAAQSGWPGDTSQGGLRFCARYSKASVRADCSHVKVRQKNWQKKRQERRKERKGEMEKGKEWNEERKRLLEAF